jgi:transcriptional regulator with XRE-family HTH domain
MEDTEGLIRRFIELRKKHGPTQAKFGQMIGVSDVTVSLIESGKIKINDKHIKLVCGTLGINETWLKTGEGSMFTEEIPGQKQLLEAFRHLSPDGRKAAIKVVEALLNSELEKTFDDGYRAGMRGIPKENTPGGMTRPPEAPGGAKPEENPIHGKKRG